MDCKQRPVSMSDTTELKRVGLAKSQQVHALQTITHPKNRGGDLLEPSDVPLKVAEISDVGWDPTKVEDASAVRIPDDPARRKAAEDEDGPLLALGSMRQAGPEIR